MLAAWPPFTRWRVEGWSRKHYSKICEKLSKKSKALLEEIKPWKPGWA